MVAEQQGGGGSPVGQFRWRSVKLQSISVVASGEWRWRRHSNAAGAQLGLARGALCSNGNRGSEWRAEAARARLGLARGGVMLQSISVVASGRRRRRQCRRSPIVEEVRMGGAAAMEGDGGSGGGVCSQVGEGAGMEGGRRKPMRA